MDSATLEQTSEQFLGEWKRLVSTTNWDKGRIIDQWRLALVEAGAAPGEYSDETWSRQVGNVTPQHVGRLRRVFERFSEARAEYEGLFWSHFQAALDWHDAEMWLEGAVQNRWSISEMRNTRAEALGLADPAAGAETPEPAAELDEDAEPLAQAEIEDAATGSIEMVRPAQKSHPATDDRSDADDWSSAGDAAEAEAPFSAEHAEPVRPFAHLASLPADVSDAFEAFKLCILKHKLAGWAELAREDLLAALDALKELAVARA